MLSFGGYAGIVCPGFADGAKIFDGVAKKTSPLSPIRVGSDCDAVERHQAPMWGETYRATMYVWIENTTAPVCGNRTRHWRSLRVKGAVSWSTSGRRAFSDRGWNNAGSS